MRRSPRILLLLALLASFALAPRDAQAENEKAEGALAWGLLATEASMAGVFALSFKVKGWPSDGPAFMVNMAPLVIGPGVAFGAYAGDFDPRPAYALHGAAAMGLDLFLVGMLIDGMNEDDGRAIGTNAWILGLLGAGAGAWVGATQVDNADEGAVFYGAPIGGFAVGGIVGMATSLLSGNTNDLFEYAVYGATGGMTLGVAGSLYFALSDAKGTRGTELLSAPKLTTDTKRFMMSFGGSF